jgi:2-iminobutanoate/2-iminopropanoate deaminase
MKFVSTTDAPAAIGPYSQAVATGNLLFVSGQIPLDPATATLVDGDIAVQTTRVLDNIDAILKAEGLTRENIVMCNVYLKNIGDFAVFNKAYEQFFGAHKPARAAFEVAALPKNAQIEISAIAEKK